MKKIITLVIVLVSLSFSESKAQAIQPFFDGADTFFKTYVFGGNVDYQAINDSPELLNSLLEKAKIIEVSSSNKAAYQAFWINAYNLSVIKGIINNYPLKT